MLLSKKVKIKWNSRNKKRFVNLGYDYTKMNDKFEVNVEHLSQGSNAIVEVKCDYCGRIFYIEWYSYKKIKDREVVFKDCCNNPKCTGIKAKESIKAKYDVENVHEIPGYIEKVKQTNLLRYGCENPFSSEEIKKKIIRTNIEKYGVPYSMQNKNIQEKAKETCLNKYGVDNYAKTKEFRETFKGENSPVWKENPIHERTERNLPEYREWRKKVFSRDRYRCQCCGIKSGKGIGKVTLHAHHIQNFKTHRDIAMDIDNGITLCENCHMKFHSLYGKSENNLEQLNEFIKNRIIDEKIC